MSLRNEKGQFAKGFKHSKEMIRKMSESHKGKSTWNKGIPCSEEVKKKIGEASKGNSYALGMKHTEEWKKKMRETMRRRREKFGYINSPETRKKISNSKKGKGNGLTGKHHSEEAKRKMSNSKKGSKSHLWKGGINPINDTIRKGIEFRLWREAVFARDNWVCQKTGIRGGILHPHHIQNFSDFPELRFAIDNGITLSEKAHKEFHKEYGVKNNTREQLDKFLNF